MTKLACEDATGKRILPNEVALERIEAQPGGKGAILFDTYQESSNALSKFAKFLKGRDYPQWSYNTLSMTFHFESGATVFFIHADCIHSLLGLDLAWVLCGALSGGVVRTAQASIKLTEFKETHGQTQST